MLKHFMPSLENQEEVADVEQDIQAPVETEEERQERLAREEQEVIADAEDQIETAENSSRDLGRIAQTLENTEQVGGATREIVTIAEVAVESVCKHLKIASVPGFSMESFDNEKTRVKATRVAVENIRTLVKGIDTEVASFKEALAARKAK